MNKISENFFNKSIEKAFKNSPEFTQWFLSQTKFLKESAIYYWSRSIRPWEREQLIIQNPETTIGHNETGMLVVFKTERNERFAIYIANKLANGAVKKFQSEFYAQRAKLWMNDTKYCSYTDFETVLIAPTSCYEECLEDAEKFNCYISYEDISAYLPVFKS